jgi:hypothetical protein
VYVAAGQFNNNYNKSNIAGAIVTTFNTYMNGNQLQPGVITPIRGDDYQRAKDRIRGSAITTSNEYYYNWCYVEDFTSGKKLYCTDEDQMDIDGLKLSGEEILYYINATINANNSNTPLNHVYYYVTQKQLDIGETMITFD